MDDVLGVRVGQRVGHVARDRDGVGHRQSFLAHQAVAEGLPSYERHRIEQQAVRDAGIEQREDMRVRQPRGNLDFAQEALGTEGAREFRTQHFQGDPAVVADVPGLIHDGHSATADLAVNRVAPCQCSGEPRLKVVHRH